MEIIIVLIIFFFFARFITRGLFDKVWRQRVQSIIDSIRNERNFWYLMKQDINAERVFTVYVRTMNQNDYIRAGDCVMDLYSSHEADPNDLDKNIIKQGDGLSIINSTLNPAILEREKIISDSLDANPIEFSEKEIHHEIEQYIEEKFPIMGLSEEFNRFISAIDLKKGHKTSVAIWTARQELSKQMSDFEYDGSGNNKIAHDRLWYFETANISIGDLIANILVSKIENEDIKAKLKKALREWEQLNMLRWCIIDYDVAWTIGTNRIQRSGWRLISTLFL
jgi:hypothetical protein